MSAAVNIHATSIVIGTTGLLFVGPSGSGKSATALHCIAAARRSGQFAALVSDDRTSITLAGGHPVASAPSTIRGLIEVRGAAVVSVPVIECTLLHYAVRPLRPPFEERIAPEDETFELLPGRTLPLLRLPIADGLDCFETLAVLMRNRPLSAPS